MEPHERSVILASASKRCADASNEEITAILVIVYNVLGIPKDKQVSDIQEIGVLNTSIKTQMRDVKLKEIEEAFLAAIRGDLKGSNGKPLDLNSYGMKFSFRFLFECVISFKKFSRTIFKNYQTKMKQIEAFPPTPPPLTAEQKKQNRKEFYEELIQFIKKNKSLPAAWAYDKAFIHAWNEGIIKDSPAEIEKFKQNVIADLQEEAEQERVKRGNGAFKELIARNSQPQTLQYQCRKRRLIAFLRTMYEFI